MQPTVKPSPELCVYAPLDLEGVAVVDVAYKVSPALYQCSSKDEYMKIWYDMRHKLSGT